VTWAPAQVRAYVQYRGPDNVHEQDDDRLLSPVADNMLHMDSADVNKYFDRIGRFRVLVIGRSNAGKTTLLQRVCNSTELPEVFNAKGEKVGCLTAQY